jgi:hypothetical protein
MSIYKNKNLGKTEYMITSQINLRAGIIFLILAIVIWLTLGINLGYEKTVILVGIEIALAVLFWQLKIMDRTTEVWIKDLIKFLKEKKTYIFNRNINKFIYKVLLSKEPITGKYSSKNKFEVKNDFKKIESWQEASYVQTALEDILTEDLSALKNEIYLKKSVYEKKNKKNGFKIYGKEIAFSNILLIFILIFFVSVFFYQQKFKNFNQIITYMKIIFEKIRG